jgi:tRNA 2-thiouridine synthesizing protein A
LDGHRLGGESRHGEPAVPGAATLAHAPFINKGRSGAKRRMLKFALFAENKTMQAFDRELDVRGLNCPLPILRAKKALGDLSAGQVLKVMATDPGSVKDFQAFCKQTGNELLSHSEGAEFTFFMKKR